MPRKILLAVVLLLLPLVISAQKRPLKFGKVPIQDIMMDVYDRDTSASAVILCDYGIFNGDDVSFSRIRRIKILKESGLDYGTFKFVSSGKPTIRGYTFNIENGEIVKEKLKAGDVLSEQLNSGIMEVVVPMPNVKVGSVIDIEVSFNGLPNEWNFQSTIPVRYSELIMKSSQYVTFNKSFFGFEPLDFASAGRYIATNMPAFKEEPYTNSVNNYMTRFEFELVEISIPGYYHKSYTGSWNTVSNFLLDNQYFGGPLSSSMCLNSVAKDIREKTSDPLERTRLAVNEIKKIKWNNKSTVYTELSGICPALKKGNGNSADVNIALIALLNKVDVKTVPVVLSTRKNGMLSLINPSLDKLNYVIARASIGDNEILIDATEKYLPYNLLPARCLNIQGRSVIRGASEWVEIKPCACAKQYIEYNLDFDNSLNLSGDMIIQAKDYAAYERRKEFYSFNSKTEYIDNLMKEKPGLKVSAYENQYMDDLDKTLSEKFKISTNRFVSNYGDEVHITPMLFECISVNEFRLEDRKYPVDFGYGKDFNVSVNINLPDGYQVSEIPEPLMLRTKDNGIVCRYQLIKNGATVKLNYSFRINKQLFIQDEYPLIKEIQNQIIKKHAEPLILKKIS